MVFTLCRDRVFFLSSYRVCEREGRRDLRIFNVRYSPVRKIMY